MEAIMQKVKKMQKKLYKNILLKMVLAVLYTDCQMFLASGQNLTIILGVITLQEIQTYK